MEQTQIFVAVIACVGTLGSALIGAVMTPYFSAYVSKRAGKKNPLDSKPPEIVKVIEREVPASTGSSARKFALYLAMFTVLAAMMLCMCSVLSELMAPTCYFDPTFGYVCS